MKKRASVSVLILVSIVFFSLLASCSQDVNPSGEIEVSNTFGASLKSGKQITVNATYRPEYFSSDSDVFNKDMALLSFVGATSMNKQACQSFYDTMGFTRQLSFGWDSEPTADSVAFLFAYKNIGGSEVVAVTVRGFNYDSEWSNNLTIGATGDHEGFSLEAEKIFTALEFYTGFYVSNPDAMKIWIMGYSRGGAISDVLAHKVLYSGLVDEDNLYAYTFEAPSSLCNEYKYSCVHDVRNSGDLIPYIPPVEWQLYRAGVETDIYSENIRTYLIEDLGFDEDDFPEFDNTKYSTPSSFITDYLINGLEKVEMLSTRAAFADNVQTPLSGFAVILMADRKKGMSVVKDYFSEKTETEILTFVLSCIAYPDYIYTTFKPLFIDAGVSFEDQKLMDASTFINSFLKAENALVFITDVFTNYSGNAKYVALSHFPEVTYVALKHYQPK